MPDPQFPFPFFPVEVTKDGKPFQPDETDKLLAALKDSKPPTDLFVMSHGWNNNLEEAKQLYAGLAGQVAKQISGQPSLAGRSFAICGILWPSKKFEEKDLIPSGAASLSDSVTEEDLKSRIDDLSDLLQAKGWPMEEDDAELESKIEELKESAEDWEFDPAVRTSAVKAIRSILDKGAASPNDADASEKFFALRPEILITNLSKSLNPPARVPQGTPAASVDPFSTGSGGGVGGAAGLRDVLGGIKGSFLHLLNYSTYYLMKSRAGDVGTKGVAPLLKKIRDTAPEVRLHLIGHSFGCRVVTTAVSALPDDPKYRPNTMTLLQAAFSHNGFASHWDDQHDGAFRHVVTGKKVRGPILITHTRNDKAVGIAYPIASRIAGQAAASLGDEHDIFGGLGSNGAQSTPERVVGTLLETGGKYPFSSGASSSIPYNLKADSFISGHSDIVNPQVAWAVSVALQSPDAV
jgi:hypothetical protein